MNALDYQQAAKDGALVAGGLKVTTHAWQVSENAMCVELRFSTDKGEHRTRCARFTSQSAPADAREWAAECIERPFAGLE